MVPSTAGNRRVPATAKPETVTPFDTLDSVEAGEQVTDTVDRNAPTFPVLENLHLRRHSNDRRLSQYRQRRISKRGSVSVIEHDPPSPTLKRKSSGDDLLTRWSMRDPEGLFTPAFDLPAAAPSTKPEERKNRNRQSGYQANVQTRNHEEQRPGRPPGVSPPTQTTPSFRSSDLPPYPPSKGSWPVMPAPTDSVDNHASDATLEKQKELLYYRKRFHVGKKTLFYGISHKYERTRPKKTVLDLSAIQRMGMHDLRRNIARKVGRMYRDGGITYSRTNEMLGDMHRYCQAVQDLEFIGQYAGRPPEQNPFVLVTSRSLDCEALSDAEMIPDYMTLAGQLPEPLDKDDPQMWGLEQNSVRYKPDRKRTLVRFSVAIFGVLALVVPMIIMVLVPGKISSLVTSSVFAVAFGAIIACVSSFKPTEILALASAYAAVLVVFVGTSLSPVNR